MFELIYFVYEHSFIYKPVWYRVDTTYNTTHVHTSKLILTHIHTHTKVQLLLQNSSHETAHQFIKEGWIQIISDKIGTIHINKPCLSQ